MDMGRYKVKLLKFENGPLFIQIRSIIYPEMIITAPAANEKEAVACLAEMESTVSLGLKQK